MFLTQNVGHYGSVCGKQSFMGLRRIFHRLRRFIEPMRLCMFLLLFYPHGVVISFSLVIGLPQYKRQIFGFAS